MSLAGGDDLVEACPGSGTLGWMKSFTVFPAQVPVRGCLEIASSEAG